MRAPVFSSLSRAAPVRAPVFSSLSRVAPVRAAILDLEVLFHFGLFEDLVVVCLYSSSSRRKKGDFFRRWRLLQFGVAGGVDVWDILVDGGRYSYWRSTRDERVFL